MAMMRTTSVSIISLFLTSSAMALPSFMDLQKRKPILVDSDTITIDHKAPLDAIILVGVALLAAFFCLILAIWNVCVPTCSGSRTVREERARAKTELRLKGAGGGGLGGTNSPTRMVLEKKRHQSSGTENISFDSHSRLTSINNSPRIQQETARVPKKNGRPSRASRGYSSYSKYDIPSMNKGDLDASLSMLAVPTLPTSYSDNASSSQSLSSGSITTSPPPIPWHARPQYVDRSQSYGSHARRISTTVGRGTDLHRNRSKKSASRKIHVNPQAVDPTYSNQANRLSPRTSASDINDPLSGLELKRYTTDPTDSREGSRRNSTMNALDFFNSNNGNRGTYTDSASDSVGHEYSGLTQPSPASPSQMTRTRNMAFYDAEQDVSSATRGHYQNASLLESGGQQQGGGRGGWRAWR